MTEEAVIQILRYTLYTAALLSAPMIIAILVIGIVTNILQTVTQIRDQSVSFIPKVVGVGVVIVIYIPWFFAIFTRYVNMVFSLFTRISP